MGDGPGVDVVPLEGGDDFPEHRGVAVPVIVSGPVKEPAERVGEHYRGEEHECELQRRLPR